jgi:hypothetical protein
VQRDTGAFAIGGVGSRRVRRAVSEEHNAASGQFDNLGFGLIGIATNVMIAVGVARVLQFFVKAAE